MAFVPLDSRLTGPLVTTPAMAGVFSERSTLAAMLAAEAALARAQARFGMVPAGLSHAILAIDPGSLDIDAGGRVGRRARGARVPRREGGQ
jgi:3-carboxy-cis,cis-muconate cycloisomerase